MYGKNPFGECKVNGCPDPAMKGMLTCGFHSARAFDVLRPGAKPNPALEMTPWGQEFGTYAAFKAAGWTDDQLITHGMAHIPTATNFEQYWAEQVSHLAAAARRAGFVIRVEQVPLEPLAMGNHRDAVTVYEKRK